MPNTARVLIPLRAAWGLATSARAQPAVTARALFPTPQPVSKPAFDRPVAALTVGDLPKFGVMLLATAATMPLDRELARRFAQPSVANNRTYHDLAANLTKI